MSTIQKLYISGIRSFSPEKPGIIDLSDQVTLIVGPNGSGKTTIIECLKYCTTGTQPQNTRNGAFIFDPKLANEFEVKAQVKLLFNSTNQVNLMCSRSLSLTRKKSGVTQKSLESLLVMKHPYLDQTTSLSAKCAEIDLEVPLQLGVSKAILENVIFCHQEDSLWPLSESSVLKKKFDDLFASTRYTSVLETIKTIRKEQAIQMRLMEQALDHIKNKKLQFESFQASKVEYNERLQEMKRKIDDLNVFIKEIADEIQEVEHNLEISAQLENKLLVMRSQSSILEKQHAELKALVSDPLDLNENLYEMRLKANSDLESCDKELVRLNELRDEHNQNHLECRAIHSRLLVEHGRLSSEIEAYNEEREKAIKIMEKIKVILADPNINEFDISAIIDVLSSKINLLHNELNIIKSHENEGSEEMNRIKMELMTLNSKVNITLTEITKNSQLLSEKTLELENIKFSRERLNDLVSKSQNLNDVALNDKIKECDEAIYTISNEIWDNDREIDKLQESILKISEKSDIIANIANNQREISSKSKELGDLSEKYLEKTKILQFNFEEGQSSLDYKELIISSKENHIRGLNEKIAYLNVSLNSRQEDLNAYSRRLGELSDSISKVSSPLSFQNDKINLEERFLNISKQVNKLYGALEVCEELVPKFNNECSFCAGSLEDLINARRRISSDLSSKEVTLKEIEASLKLFKERELDFNEYTYTNLKTPEIKSKINSIQDEIDAFLLELSKERANIEILKKEFYELQDIKSMKDNIASLELRVMSLNEENTSMKRELNINFTCKDDVILRQRTFRSENESLKKRLEDIKNDKILVTQRKADLNLAASDLQEEIHSYKLKEVEFKSKEFEVNSLKSLILKLEEELNSLRNKICELEPKVAQSEQFLLERIKTLKVSQDEHLAKISALQKYLDELIKYKELERVHIEKGRDNLLKLCHREITETQKEINKLQNIQTESNSKIEEVIERISNAKSFLRNIDDNIRMKALEREIDKISNEKKVLETNLRENKYFNLTSRLQELQTQNMNLLNERSVLMGESKQITNNISNLEANLISYKDVNEEYKKQIIAYKTEELARSDLNTYHKALENSITKYHSHKMSEINKIIHELWVSTYMNSDIDYIEIRSEAEDNKGVKSYNYRVVMIKGGIPLDMRGRCSAGQKMISSIIIRLALAESFCLNCNIFALDEPTTNIDQDNMKGLMMSLAKIIDNRRQQKNFQFMLITHDEKFIQMFAEAGHIRSIWKVAKDEK